jgi:hypothetical protein
MAAHHAPTRQSAQNRLTGIPIIFGFCHVAKRRQRISQQITHDRL